MKKVIFVMLTVLLGLSAQAQSFSYLRFNSGTGAEQCVSTDGLKIIFNNGNLVATSNGGNATIALSAMNFMYFSNNGSTELLKGDVNRDGDVNVSDLTTLINMLLGRLPVDEEVADLNGTDGVELSDITYLINILLGKI